MYCNEDFRAEDAVCMLAILASIGIGQQLPCANTKILFTALMCMLCETVAACMAVLLLHFVCTVQLCIPDPCSLILGPSMSENMWKSVVCKDILEGGRATGDGLSTWQREMLGGLLVLRGTCVLRTTVGHTVQWHWSKEKLFSLFCPRPY